MNKKKIIVTGSCGFIGFHVCKCLIENNFKVIGIDNLDNYYDVKIKIRRLNLLRKDANFKLQDLKTEQTTLEKIFVSLVKENNEV